MRCPKQSNTSRCKRCSSLIHLEGNLISIIAVVSKTYTALDWHGAHNITIFQCISWLICLYCILYYQNPGVSSLVFRPACWRFCNRHMLDCPRCERCGVKFPIGCLERAELLRQLSRAAQGSETLFVVDFVRFILPWHRSICLDIREVCGLQGELDHRVRSQECQIWASRNLEHFRQLKRLLATSWCNCKDWNRLAREDLVAWYYAQYFLYDGNCILVHRSGGFR